MITLRYGPPIACKPRATATQRGLDGPTPRHYTANDKRSFRGHLPPIAATLNKVLKSERARRPFTARAILFSPQESTMTQPAIAVPPIAAKKVTVATLASYRARGRRA